MSTYDLLRIVMRCPRCGSTREAEVEVFFGCGNLIEYKVGDTVQWVARKAPQNGGRPADGSCDGMGYVECEGCHKDFFVKVLVRNDVLVDAVPDTDREGYIV